MTKRLARAALLLALLCACDVLSRGGPPRESPPSPVAPPSGSPPVGPVVQPTEQVGPATGSTQTELSPAGGTLAAQLAAGAARARSQGLTPFAYFHATWCEPCQAVARYHDEPRMSSAFAGTAILGVDIDVWGAQVASAGFDADAIPAWEELDATGHAAGHHIDGGAWGDNIPENMAAPLDAYFHHHAE